MNKFSIPGAIVFGCALLSGVALAIWGGVEYAGYSKGLIGLALGTATRLGMLGGSQ